MQVQRQVHPAFAAGGQDVVDGREDGLIGVDVVESAGPNLVVGGKPEEAEAIGGHEVERPPIHGEGSLPAFDQHPLDVEAGQGHGTSAVEQH